MAAPETTLDAVSLQPAEAIAFLRQKVNVTSQRWTDVWNEAHTRSFMVAGAATRALVQDFRDAVSKAIEQGTSIGAFRKEFDAIVAKHGWVHNGEPGWRASIIYETNLATAYSAGRYAQMSEPDTLRVYPYWQYLHTSSARPRPQHLLWVGTTLRADDAWWSTHYPPNGWRCKCSVRPVSEAGLRRQGKRGPDQAPPLQMQKWRSADGRVVTEVPLGIDPGFAYNPGQAWQEGLPPPAAPSSPLEPVRGRMPPAEAVAPPAAAADAEFGQWIDDLLDKRRGDGSSRIVGTIPEPAMAHLKQLGLAPASDAISLRASDVLHLTRDTKRAAGKAIGDADLRRLPALLAKPDAVLRDRVSGELLFVFSQSRPDKKGKLVVRIGHRIKRRGGADIANVLLTAGIVAIQALRNKRRYDVLDGSV